MLLYGPPGVGKTLIARCIANAADCIFLNLCATELIQVYIGEGSSILQEVFELAKEYVEFGTINGVPAAVSGVAGTATVATTVATRHPAITLDTSAVNAVLENDVPSTAGGACSVEGS